MSPESEAMTVPSSASTKTRPLYWSVRREVWEHPAVYMAPLIAAGVVLLGLLMSAGRLIHVHASTRGMGSGRGPSDLWPGMPGESDGGSGLPAPYSVAAMAVMAAGLIVALFYCLNALHNERRDRSVLFWKSLPVSDLVTVLSKAAVPMAVVPLAILGVTVATHLAMLVVNAATLITHGVSPLTLATGLPLIETWIKLAYVLVAIALWLSPVYAWLLLVSGWARRSPFLWAVLPVAAICIVEKLALDTAYFGGVLKNRLAGVFKAAFTDGEIDPLHFLSTPALWAGLIVAAGLFAATVWQRRYRDPT